MTALYLHEDAKELLADKTLVVLGDSGNDSYNTSTAIVSSPQKR